MSFNIGDKVVKNPTTWKTKNLQGESRGVGVGTIVEPPFLLDPTMVDVRWPRGRCFEPVVGLSLLNSLENTPA
jgi:hypothetical protein